MKRTTLAKISKNPANIKLRKKKAKAVTITKLKKHLHALQKQIVIKKFGTDCYTCNSKNLQVVNCQLGHVPWPRSILSAECAFSWEFTRIQCFSCNINRGGMGAEALERMKREGIDTDAMRRYNQMTKGQSYGKFWVENKIKEYESLLAQP